MTMMNLIQPLQGRVALTVTSHTIYVKIGEKDKTSKWVFNLDPTHPSALNHSQYNK